jgi:hypothetical protein
MVQISSRRIIILIEICPSFPQPFQTSGGAVIQIKALLLPAKSLPIYYL